MKTIFAAAFLALSPALTWADVEVINYSIPARGNYKVPDGKVLLLEAGVNNSEGTGDLEIRIPGAAFDFPYNTNTNMPTGDNRRQPLYLEEGAMIMAPSTNSARRFIIFGRLVTPDELYASNGSSAEIEVSGGKTTVVAKSDSPRPVKFDLEESSDLVTWMKAIVSGFSTTKNSISAEIETSPGEQRKFVRAVAKEVPVGTDR